MAKFKEGAPCHAGHTLKYEKNGNCVECTRLKGNKRHRFVDHHTLTDKILNIPDVNGIFWQAKTGAAA